MIDHSSLAGLDLLHISAMYRACASLSVLSGQLDSVSVDIPNVCGIALISLLLLIASDLFYGEH